MFHLAKYLIFFASMAVYARKHDTGPKAPRTDFRLQPCLPEQAPGLRFMDVFTCYIEMNRSSFVHSSVEGQRF